MNVEDLKCFTGVFTHPDLRNFDPKWLGKVIEDFDDKVMCVFEQINANWEDERWAVNVLVNGVFLPSLVKANIEQLANLYAPAIALLIGFDEHCELNDSEINTEDMRLNGYGELCLVGDYGNHHFVNFTDYRFDKVRGTVVAFSFPRETLNSKTATLCTEIVRKALEITSEHMGVMKFGNWSCYGEDLWYYDSYFALHEIRRTEHSKHGELIKKYKPHINDFLKVFSEVMDDDKDREA